MLIDVDGGQLWWAASLSIPAQKHFTCLHLAEFCVIDNAAPLKDQKKIKTIEKVGYLHSRSQTMVSIATYKQIKCYAGLEHQFRC